MPTISSVAFGALSSGALIATVIDIRVRRIPNALTATMMGPTTQGIQDLIAQDTVGAHWNPSAGTHGQVQDSGGRLVTTNPRIFPIPLYDPAYYDAGKRNGRTADLRTANWICFFANSVSGNDIIGIIVPCRGEYDKNGPAPNSASPRAIRLVQ